MKAVYLDDFIVNKGVWLAMKRVGGSAGDLADAIREGTQQKTRATSVYQWLTANSIPLTAMQAIQTLFPDIERTEFRKMLVVSMTEKDLKF